MDLHFKTRVVVTGIVKFGDKVLLLKRSPLAEASPNLWQSVSGSPREKEVAENAVLREVLEETGLGGIIERVGSVFEVIDEFGRWISLPYLVSVDSSEVKLSNEHTEYRWVIPDEIMQFELVAGTDRDLKSVGLL